MSVKWLYLFLRVAFSILPNFYFINSTIRSNDKLECKTPESIDNHLLPANLRIIKAPQNDDVGYSLVNPQTQNSVIIPGTNYSGYVVFANNSGRLLFLKEKPPDQIEWVTMNVDGSAPHVVRTASYWSYWPITQILSEDNLLLLDRNPLVTERAELVPSEVFKLQNDTFTLVPATHLVDFVPLDPVSYPELPRQLEFNADATRIAYSAYQRKDDGSLAYGEPPLIRIQNLRNDEYIDIKPINWDSAVLAFYWSNTIDRITGEIGGLGDYVQIFDAFNGNLLAQIAPPDVNHELSAQGLSWSPDKQRFAIEWNIHYDILVPLKERPYESILAIYDFRDSPQLVKCLMLPRGATDENDDGLGTYRWSDDGALIWWLACPDADFICPEEYDLMINDLNSSQYGALAKKVNLNTLISFLSVTGPSQ